MAKQYIWWITNDAKGAGSMGHWNSKKEAEQAIADGLKQGFLKDDVKWTVEKHEITLCPTCGRPAEKDIIDGLGECLNCDHVRGDIDNDFPNEVPEDDTVGYN